MGQSKSDVLSRISVAFAEELERLGSRGRLDDRLKNNGKDTNGGMG